MRLRRSTPYGAGIRRVRRGRGFSYADENGVPVTDPEVTQRIDALVIPPAWRKVWICPHAQGHIQAVGWMRPGGGSICITNSGGENATKRSSTA
ncbi:DNA topoisomerase IB [Nocardia kruczakiae]|uniref:DNA topoisomerase IB n=1 Tax=Nocardia kruczakiae TaxID=261477 RepID=A0ABU1X870_9NOCA|nr:DNA topoisomerase IB [Nocardia kruczakiae]